MSKISIRQAELWKKTDEELAALARRSIQREVLVTNNPGAIEFAFFMILPLVELTEAAIKCIGTVIGDYAEVVPGRAMNRYPIFTSCSFLHKDDLPKYNEIKTGMLKALGVDHDKD